MLEAENSDTGAVGAAANLNNEEGGGGGSVSGGFGEEGYRNLAGNRWPREETLALLKIRSDMDVAFRDSTLKAPLWDEVSRKLAELGYNRSAKKCKEKFENIYKYHKRTRDCRSNRPNTKNYRFFEQLERLDNHPSLPSPSKNQIKPSNMTETTMVNMTTIKPSNFPQDFPNSSAEFFMSTSASASATSSSELGNGKKKRGLGDYFERLVKQVLEKQEDLQNKFMEALDKCEKDRIVREEAWKAQESARMEREKQVLAQERAIAAAKDAAVIAFLQKISDHPLPIPENPTPIPNPGEEVVDRVVAGKCGISNVSQTGSSRWPKAEVEALISVRANLEFQYQDNGSPKGPLWEEISSSMKKLGYNRSAKRCKEKWENINKYFRRVKESNKKRPQDSKTCPYFDMLESLYEKKAKMGSSGFGLKPEDILMQMMGQTKELQQRHETAKGESENVDQNGEDFGDDEDGDDEDENENVDDYQIVANSTTSMTKIE